MAYPQFGYACPTVSSALPTSQLLMSGSSSPQTSVAGGVPTSCCESGRPIMTDPSTGQTVCSCQYGSAAAGLLSYPRVASLTDTVYSSAYATQGYVPFGTDPSAFYAPINPAYDLKDNSDAWRSLAHPTPCYPYDPTMTAGYPYGQSALAQRKNATREATSTLKAWLQEHIKNPYPTKGEKIMLAIITKMTLTQVSTWFANARRRLKKENKMTWSPRNRTDEDGNKIDSDDEDDDKNNDDDDKKNQKHKDDDEDDSIDAGRESAPLNICGDDSVNDILSDPRTDGSDRKDEERSFGSSCGLSGSLRPTHAQSSSPLSALGGTSPTSQPSFMGVGGDPLQNSHQKPRIWSLADVATSENTPGSGPPLVNRHPNLLQQPNHNLMNAHHKMVDSYSSASINSFRPWVNGSSSYAQMGGLSGLSNPGVVGAPNMNNNTSNTNNNNTGNPHQTAQNTNGLLRPYTIAPRTEVH